MIDQYPEKIYSGLLGMNIGIRLGAPVEPTIWTYDRIRETYGEITDYVKQYKNFAADDDANGPVYFLRALYDDAADRPLEPQDVARAWLNYAREGVGMFWWGGYGCSTEHTAYLNLKAGIPAPQSGSTEQNGKIIAEQIGGQIFIDTWGLVNPCNTRRAADYGAAAASVSHDGEAVYGARFFCAAIAKAFETSDINAIMAAGFAEIPEECLYRKVSDAVLHYYRKNPNDWRACRQMLEDNWGYDKYGGVCHIIPNAGVCILSMAYGEGDFARTVEIATMCGWDTDCNAGNVGTVLGVACGLEGLPLKYRSPINDGIVLSGISGYLNILDIPTYSREIALLGYRICGEPAPESLKASIHPGEIHFDFKLPGSTHNMRVSDTFFCRAAHSEKHGGTLEVLIDRMKRGDRCKLFYKPFYRREDFSDERYSPVFTPTAYPGQRVSMRMLLDHLNGWETPGVAPYVRSTSNKKEYIQGFVKLEQDRWIEISFTIPDLDGDTVDEVGVVIEGYSVSKAKTLGFVYLDSFSITGAAQYTIAMKKQVAEFASVTPFAVDHGAWGLENGELTLMRCEPSFAYTGNYYASDYSVSAPVTPLGGDSHLLLIRAQGAMRGYAGGLAPDGSVRLYKNDFGFRELASTSFKWEHEQTYALGLKANGSRITLHIDGQEILSADDNAYTYGMFGCGSLDIGRTAFGDFTFKDGDES
jgi:ADP-ribosylglycohydrolase